VSAAAIAAVVLLAVAAFIAVLASWDAVEAYARGTWRRYATWAGEGLERLHLPLSVRDFALRHAILIIGGWVLGSRVGSAATGLALAFAGAVGPSIWMKRAIVARRKKIENQLDAALQTVANNLLATQNLVDGFGAVAAHLEPPISQEAELVVRDVKVGARTEEALTNLSTRCQSLHVDACVTALTIGIRTGGDLGKVLKTIAGVVRETLRCEGLMASKTSEGRTSAWVMGSMPAVFMVAMHWVSPEWMEPLWNDGVGSVILVVAAVLTLLGMMLVLKISRIDP
jgi:tight adherence protein B